MTSAVMTMSEPAIVFRLYVAGQLPNSARAMSNLKLFCETHLSIRYSLDVLDVYEDPEAALAESVFMTPQLVVQSESGKHVLIGDLSDTSRLSQLLSRKP